MSNASMWALTSYYNPFKGQRRRRNYSIFRAHLGVPLVTVEWAPDGQFELGPGDADILVQVAGGDVLWQKERLLNIGLNHLPPDCTHLATLDCDVLFDQPGWAEEAIRVLQASCAAQLFDTVNYLPPAPDTCTDLATLRQLPPETRTWPLAAALARGEGLYCTGEGGPVFGAPAGALRVNGNPGLGHAFHADMIRELQFYDANVVGGADLLMLTALSGHLEEHLNRRCSPAHTAHTQAWARKAGAPGRHRVGVVPATLHHLWHGTFADRRYSQRYEILSGLDYDPAHHLAPHGGGAWSWSDAAGELPARVREYLQSRNDA